MSLGTGTLIIKSVLTQARGFSVSTMAVERGEWAAVLRALLTRDYWAGRCTTDPAYTWYLQRLKATIDAARLATGRSASEQYYLGCQQLPRME